ncbi:uncharacterized protein LOC126755913 [Bactrocera neohumeralis]|uniref:uncharacterized protein LOC126755913 n=1 Tax=Bactrocera neohumeralis TaxID=98809 RepID=UPI002165AC7E|nr:uncharacterized protein LOC126755913 [Bactrocera neohumeralis]
MQTLIFTILVATLIVSTTAVLPFAVAKAEADEDVIYLLGQNTVLGGSADPEITSQCFTYYMPILNQISLNFSMQYELCVTAASQAATKLSASAAQNRAILVNETTTICNAFASCNNESNILDFLSCYATAASADIHEFFNISTNASNAAVSLKSGLQQISDTEQICQNKAQQTYSSQAMKTYKELYACFANGLPTASTSASTSGITVNT